jgi:hypothetical protein
MYLVVIVVSAIFLAWGVICLATYEPFVTERFPFRFDILRIENTTTGDPADGLPDLTIYVKNVDRDNKSVQFDTENCLNIDRIPITGHTIDPSDGLLEAGKMASITISDGGKKLGKNFYVELVTVENWGIRRTFWVGWDVGVDGNTIS